MQLFLDNIGAFGHAILTTLALTAVGFIGSMIIGSLTAIFRVSPIAPLRIAGTFYVEVFRNMPLLSLLIIMVFGLPDVGLRLSLFWSVSVAMMLVGGAFAGEAIRSGINAVPVGNAEAARSIGLTFAQSLAFVIMPQALAAMVQPIVNVFIGQLLGSSLAAAMNVNEITYQVSYLNLQYAGGLGLYAIAAALYVIMALLSGQAGGILERKLAVHR